MRVAVVATSAQFGPGVPRQLDGYIGRQTTILRSLMRHHDVTVIHLQQNCDSSAADWPDDLPVTPLSVPAKPGNRSDRAVRLLRRGMGGYCAAPHERKIIEELEAARCDVVFLLTYRSLDLARVISRVFRTVLFAEEAVEGGTDGWGLAPGLWGRLEAIALRRALSRVACIAVIAPTEVSWAKEEFGRRTVVIPHSIDANFWCDIKSVHEECAARRLSGHDVFVIGNFSSYRNAKGLRDVVDEIEARPRATRQRLVVASGAGLHDILSNVPAELLKPLGAVADPRPWYRAAKVTLVPSRIVRGVKTTILQGWITGCPVVATEEAAASVAGRHGIDLLIGRTPSEIVENLSLVHDDEKLSDTLRTNGLNEFNERYSSAAVDRALDALLDHYPW